MCMPAQFLETVSMDPQNMKKNHFHPLRLLYSAIALSVVVWSVLYYQIQKVQPITEEAPPTKSNVLSEAERAKVVAEINTATAKIPPLTNEQRNKILADINTKTKNIQPLSEEERIRIINSI